MTFGIYAGESRSSLREDLMHVSVSPPAVLFGAHSKRLPVRRSVDASERRARRASSERRSVGLRDPPKAAPTRLPTPGVLVRTILVMPSCCDPPLAACSACAPGSIISGTRGWILFQREILAYKGNARRVSASHEPIPRTPSAKRRGRRRAPSGASGQSADDVVDVGPELHLRDPRTASRGNKSTLKNPGSGNSEASLVWGELRPLQMRICSGRTSRSSDYYLASGRTSQSSQSFKCNDKRIEPPSIFLQKPIEWYTALVTDGAPEFGANCASQYVVCGRINTCLILSHFIPESF